MTNQEKANLWLINPMSGKPVISARDQLKECFGNSQGVIYHRMRDKEQNLYGELISNEPLYKKIHSCNIWKGA